MAFEERLKYLESRMRLVRLVWSGPGVLLLLLFSMLPIYAPLMPGLDGWLNPVTTRIVFVDPATRAPLFDPVTGAQRIPFTVDPEDPTSILVRFTYTKTRQCDYLSTEAKLFGTHVDFENTKIPNSTRLPGPQTSQTWRLHTMDFSNLEVFFIHRCNPLWSTYTRVFP